MTEDWRDFVGNAADPLVREYYQELVANLVARGVSFDLSDCEPGTDLSRRRPCNGLWAMLLALLSVAAEREIGQNPENYFEIWQEYRDAAYQKLFEGGYYYEPWISLVDTMFFGSGPTTLDLERYIESIGNEVERHLKSQTEVTLATQAMTRRLHQSGYQLLPGEVERLEELAWRSTLTGIPALRRRDLGQRQVERMDQPNHWVWPAILAEFFQV